ncbi:MAG: site-2 protease family protein [Anaerolineaceae bacterium]|jgi:regulator of sigma E protease|nr:site-2 protease family protein [Anaerolineaceae bacterium]
MTTFLTILQFVFVFGLLVFFHELGHFLTAKSLGIQIEEFGFGYPPRLLKLFSWKGTDVTLNWIPFGGFVRPKGEGDETVEGGMAAAPAWKRLLVLVSGAGMNFLIGILVLVLMFSAIGSPVQNQALITDIAPNSPAATAALQTGDVITAVNGTTLKDLDHMSKLIQDSLGKPLSFSLLREGKSLTIELTPRLNPPEGEGSVGIWYTNAYAPLPFFQALGSAFQTFGFQAKQTLLLPYNLITGRVSGEDARLVGIKGIFDIFSNASELDQTSAVAAATPLPVFRLSVISTVSIALGLTNLLPIPALDGGQILFLLPEFIFKKRIPQRVANAINSVFFILLIGLMFFITVQDFINPIIQP